MRSKKISVFLYVNTHLVSTSGHILARIALGYQAEMSGGYTFVLEVLQVNFLSRGSQGDTAYLVARLSYYYYVEALR